MIVFRIALAKYAGDLSGKGAELNGGRWNSKGLPMVYTSENRSLSMAEVAVHLPVGLIPEGFQIVAIDIPDEISIQTVSAGQLSRNWNSYPFRAETVSVGDDFLRKMKFAILRVPSAVVKGEFNYLINPLHAEAGKIRVVDTEDFHFDLRLFAAREKRLEEFKKLLDKVPDIEPDSYDKL